jgi:hypothetical protein
MLSNPLGLFALLGIPAVLAIHFLQRKAIELPTSTLFLLERTQRETIRGRRLDRLIPSIPLWMQILAVLLLTWILVEPRYPKSQSVQRIAVVVDSSASMSVFKNDAINRFAAELPDLQGPASAIELTVLESAPNRPRIYAGSSVDAFRAAFEKWQPRDGVLDPSESLRLARSLVSREGIVVFLTDTPRSTLPFESRLLSVGEPIENVGITGISFAYEQGTIVWRASVKNYGTQPADRTWSLQTATGSTEMRPIHLEPGSLITLQSAFPADSTQLRIVLSGDRFPLDDTFPFVKPQPKPLAIFASRTPALTDLQQKLLRSLDSTGSTTDPAAADLTLLSQNPSIPLGSTGNALVFLADDEKSTPYLRGAIVAEAHPLVDDLNWQSLLVRESQEIPRQPSDQVLLWQEKRPLIFLRETAATKSRPQARQLFFNFDFTRSNLGNQPAFIVLLHRFAETVRAAKIAPTSENLETGQPLRLASTPGQPIEISQTDPAGKILATAEIPSFENFHAPLNPGFLTAAQNGQTLLTAAVHFADTREADFSGCGTANDLAVSNQSLTRTHTRPDPLWQIWVFLLIAALLIAWKFSSPKSSPLITDH